jgi:Nuclear protein 96
MKFSLYHFQLMDWVSIGMSGFISEERLKAMVVCGGGQAMLSQEDGATLNSLQHLSWLSALAAHAWYICSPASSVPDIVGQYDASFQQQQLAAAPVPPLGSEACLDVRYQLLKLFAQRTYPLEQLLTPETHYPESPLDFSLRY